MSVKRLKILLVVSVFIGVCLSGYLYYQTRQLNSHILFLDKELDTAGKKNKALSKKYAQEKAKLGTCMRVQMAEQSRNMKLQKDLTSLTAEKEKLEQELTTIETKFQTKIEAYKAKIAKYKAAREEMIAAMGKLREKYKESVLSGRKKDDKIGQLTFEKKDLESELMMTERSLGRSNKHNAKLCKIAEELTQKYRERAGGGDPFTKLKMVEVEHMIQEYIKKIDKERVIQ